MSLVPIFLQSRRDCKNIGGDLPRTCVFKGATRGLAHRESGGGIAEHEFLKLVFASGPPRCEAPPLVQGIPHGLAPLWGKSCRKLRPIRPEFFGRPSGPPPRRRRRRGVQGIPRGLAPPNASGRTQFYWVPPNRIPNSQNPAATGHFCRACTHFSNCRSMCGAKGGWVYPKRTPNDYVPLVSDRLCPAGVRPTMAR